MQREETGEKTTRLVPQWPGIDRGGVVFHELSRPRYPRVKFQWLFDRAPAARAALPTCMNCKTLSRGATPPPAALLPWVFARCETMLRGYSMDWFVCALSSSLSDSSSTSLKRSSRLIQGVRNRSTVDSIHPTIFIFHLPRI